MRSKPVAALLVDLDVAKTHSPRLSHKKLIDIWCTIESINPAINE